MSAQRWTSDGNRITDEAVRTKLRVIAARSALIVEHRFYMGGRAAHSFVCEDVDELEAYIAAHASPGDSFWVWDYVAVCRDDNAAVTGKVPDAEGRTPVGGAY